MNYDSFSHGQMKSKLWLAEKLEPYISNQTIVVLGSWYNVIALILKCRGYKGKIIGIDRDPEVKSIADKICNMWSIEGSVENITGFSENVSFPHAAVVINCSSEHMSTEWFSKTKKDSLICVQSSNMTEPGEPWFIKTPSPNLESFKQKYNLSQTLYCDTLRIQYENWGYDRYMLIGIK